MLTETEIETSYPDIYNSLLQCLRYNKDEAEVYLNKVVVNDKIGETETNAHCYFIGLDGNRRPRMKDFARFIASKVTDYAIPRKEIIRALNEGIERKSASPTDKINQKARSLFNKLPESGEGGEIILSVLAESFLKLPQLFTKMILKTNTDMHVHGSDGLHAGVNRDGHLALYWGESKLYADVTEAVRNCFTSIAPFLLDTGGVTSIQNRDLELMRDGIDLNNEKLEEALKSYLDPDNPLFNKVEFRGLCLIGFDSDKYPTAPNSTTTESLKEEIKKIFIERKTHIRKRVFEENIESFVIELFLLPFPSVDEFRAAFRKELGLGNE